MRGMLFVFGLVAVFFLGSASHGFADSGGRDFGWPEAKKMDAPGVRMILIDTPKGRFKVWTKRVGRNPRVKVLLLHGGPGATHEYLEVFDNYFPGEDIEYFYYDQLGSYYSDNPDEPELWEVDRFVEEIEQVRIALDLSRQNFYLYGQSWGGILAIEYALKYQEHLKGLIISNMMSSVPAYNQYAETVLMPEMDQEALAKIKGFEAAKDYANPQYAKLLMEHHNVHHVLRMPEEQWPKKVKRSFGMTNKSIYIPMQGPSELGASGKLANWDRSGDLIKIRIPTLVIGGRFDTMDPKHMRWMAGELWNGRYLHCVNGSHLPMYDDAGNYFRGLFKFIWDVESGRM